MNRENAAAFLPLVQALAEGKTIQYNNDVSGWVDVENPSFDGSQPEWFRIKPEPREWWFNIYNSNDGYGYTTKQEADNAAARNRQECVRVREILDDKP